MHRPSSRSHRDRSERASDRGRRPARGEPDHTGSPCHDERRDPHRGRTRPALHQHDPDPVDGRGAGGQLRATRARRSRWRRWPTPSGNSFLRFDPADPIWPNRDRFVLSAGHASMLLYSLLHLTGVRSVDPKYEILGEPSVPLESIKKFRQLDSKCPGHPEYRWTSGVETTTGPLGQGVATSVGMAVAGKWMAAPLQPARVPDVRLRRLRHRRRRLPDGRGQLRGRQPRRAPEALEPLLDLRQQPHHHRGVDRRWPSPTTWPPASSAPAGTSPGSATPTTWQMLARAFQHVQERAAPADPDHRRQPHRLRDGRSRTRTRPTASRWARRSSPSSRSGSASRPSPSTSPTASTTTSARGSATGASRSATPGTPSSTSTRPATPSWPTSSTGSSVASCPRAGTRDLPTFPADDEGRGRPRGVVEGAQRGRASTSPG